MIVPTWLPFVISISIAICLLVIIYYRPYKSKMPIWMWINKHVIGLFGSIVLSAVFIPILISWTAPRIWIVTADGEMSENLIVLYYKGVSLGISDRFVENGTPSIIIAEKVFYGKPKPNTYPKDEIYYLEPSEIIDISGEPYKNRPGRIIRDKHYGAPHTYGRYQWFVYKL